MSDKRYPAVIVATCVLPWSEENELLEDAFRSQVAALRTGLTQHLYVFGTAGEGYAVTDAQFRRVAEVFREETAAPGVHAMLGVVSLSLGTVVERIELGRELGFGQFQLSLPGWGALLDSEVDTFFAETCGRFPDCQFLHYNLQRSKRVLVGDDYARLARAHPNLVAVKSAQDDPAFLEDLLVKAPEIQFFFGELGYAAMRDRFECGLLISLANTSFAGARRFFEARGADLTQIAKQELRPNLDALLECVADSEVHMDGAFDKMLWRLHQPGFPLRLLPPYGSPSEAMFARFKAGLHPSWLPEAGEL